MRLINKSSSRVSCFVESSRKKYVVGPLQILEIPFVPGDYRFVIEKLYQGNLYFDLWEILTLEKSRDIHIGDLKATYKASFSQVSSAEVSSIQFVNEGKSPVKVTYDEHWSFVLQPRQEYIYTGPENLGLRAGKRIVFEEGGKQEIIITKDLNKINFGLIR